MLLDAGFPRTVGDLAHGRTFDFPVHYEVTKGASVECTNLPPYSQAVRDRTGLPVWDGVTFVSWLQAGAAGLRDRS